jgi:hypothetical protein
LASSGHCEKNRIKIEENIFKIQKYTETDEKYFFAKIKGRV